MKPEQKLRILLEMRPALDGYAGIPQETRLLFCGLCKVDSVEVEGLIQASLRFLAEDTRKKLSPTAGYAETTGLNHYSRVVLSIDSRNTPKLSGAAMRFLKRRLVTFTLTFATLLLPYFQKVKTSFFESRNFETFIWQTLFAKTLAVSDFDRVVKKNFRICSVPWNIFQSVGLHTLKFLPNPIYPKLDTQGTDIFITQTPYPARIDPKTVMVVRYHDALPILMPDMFPNKARHHAVHLYALKSNVQSGAYFACVSEATRQDLLRLFPEVRDRAVTIHNMISPHFYEEDSLPERVPQIVRARLNFKAVEAHPKFVGNDEQEHFYQKHLGELPFKYLLMVSTIEPRKNHRQLIAAWAMIRAQIDPSIKLVIVGGLGWDYEPIMREMRAWIDRGALFVLNNVPASELRVLYRHAAATVCPSFAEGFDFSGVEAICSGGFAIASDIPVHREVYDDAAEYFDTCSTTSLVNTFRKVLYSSDSSRVRDELRIRGRQVSARYAPDKILPQWESFLWRISQKMQSH